MMEIINSGKSEILITKEMFDKYSKNYNVVPVIKKLNIKKEHIKIIDLLELFNKTDGNSNYNLFLHSPKGGRYSYLAIDTPLYFIGDNTGLTTQTFQKGKMIQDVIISGNALTLLEQTFLKYLAPIIPDAPNFYGGLIGYFSYDAVQLFEELPNLAVDDIHMPLYYFGLVKSGLVYDHQLDEFYIFTNKLNEESYSQLVNDIELIEKLIYEYIDDVRAIEQFSKSDDEHSNDKLYYESIKDSETTFSQAGFCDAVDKVINYIKNEEVSQVNLSVRHTVTTNQSPINIFRNLVASNPSPYMAFIQTPEFSVASSSPELLVKLKQQTLTTRPIGGTRSRGKDVEEDLRMMDELRSNEKEVAEHSILVELECNDFNKVCESGTVVVDEFLTLEKYSHVIHLVSNIKGKIQKDKNLFDVFKAVFPGGSITGAPKHRTMEIIEELEPAKRGLYTGSIGWIGFQQDMELNIVIRTAIIKDNIAYIQAGAGIVHNSIPLQEYKESLKKARAAWEAVCWR